MVKNENKKLVLDTLQYGFENATSSIFVNEPGLKLIQADASCLEFIKEELIKASGSEQRRDLPGLSYVIGALLIISTKYSPDTLVPFIRSLPPAFMKEVVIKIPVWFNKYTGTYNFEVAPPQDLVEFVRELTRSEDPPMKKTAERALRFLNEDGPP